MTFTFSSSLSGLESGFKTFASLNFRSIHCFLFKSILVKNLTYLTVFTIVTASISFLILLFPTLKRACLFINANPLNQLFMQNIYIHEIPHRKRSKMLKLMSVLFFIAFHKWSNKVFFCISISCLLPLG